MIRFVVTLALFLLPWTVCACAQAAPKITITLAPEIRSETVTIQYYLYGSFGGAGQSTTPEPKVHSYQIEPVYQGKLASNVKGVIFAPGCEFDTFDVDVRGETLVEEAYKCVSLPTVSLVGHVFTNKLMEGKDLEVIIRYLGYWECGFFELPDCMVPQIELARVPVDADGKFEATITDFSPEQTSTTAHAAELNVVLRDRKTWNLIGIGLRPTKEFQTSSPVGLQILPSYASPVEFLVAEETPHQPASTR